MIYRVLIASVLLALALASLLLADAVVSVPFAVTSAYLAQQLLFAREPFRSPLTWVLGIYLGSFSLAFAVPTSMLADFGYVLEYEYGPSILLAVGVILLIYPLRHVTPLSSSKVGGPSVLLDFLGRWAWLPALYSSVYLAPFALRSFQLGADVVRGQELSVGVLPSSVATTLAVGVAQFFPLYIILWYRGRIRGDSRVTVNLLLLGVVAGALWGAVFAARDVFLWIPATFLFLGWILGERRSQGLGLYRRIAVPAALSLPVFTLYTLQRFSGSTGGLWNSFLGYYGMQPYVFAETVSSLESFYGLSLRFPLVAEILGRVEQVDRSKHYQWQFGTMLADFYAVSGWTGYVFLIVIWVACWTWLFRWMRSQPHAGYLLSAVIYFNLVIQGVFYFRSGSSSGNQYLALTALLVILLWAEYRFSSKRKRSTNRSGLS